MKKVRKSAAASRPITRLELREELRKYATKKNVEGAVDELAQLTDKNFRRIEGKMATKDDLKGFATKDDLKGFATKKDIQQAEERIVQRVVHEMQVAREQEIGALEAAHKDELVSVEDKAKAPTPWQSMPRRLTALEMDVEKIKDQLEIS